MKLLKEIKEGREHFSPKDESRASLNSFQVDAVTLLKAGREGLIKLSDVRKETEDEEVLYKAILVSKILDSGTRMLSSLEAQDTLK